MTRDAEMTATDFVDAGACATSPARPTRSGLRAIPGYAGPGRSTSTPPRSNRAALRATWEAGLRDLLHAAEPGSDHQLTFAPRVRRRRWSPTEAMAELAGLLDGSRDARRARRRHRPALGAAGRPGQGRRRRRRPDRRGARARPHDLRPGARRGGARLAARPPRRRPRPGHDAGGQSRRPQRDPPLDRASVHAHGQEDLLAPYVEKYLEAADTVWERDGHPHGLEPPRGRLPLPARQPGAGRADRPRGWTSRRPTRPPSGSCTRGVPTWCAPWRAQARDAQA